MSRFANLVAAVTSFTNVIDSAVSLLGGLYDQLKAALDNGDEAEIAALIESINEQRNELAAAVAANTPVAPGDEPTELDKSGENEAEAASEIQDPPAA